MKLGLVEPLPGGALYMSNIELLIGQSSSEGERKRRARLALQAQKALPDTGADKCPPELEIEKEIKIEKEIERELETGQPDRPPAPAAYGRYKNVCLAENELDELKAEFPADYEDYIERLSRYMASSGKHYQNHAATIRYWITKDREKNGKQRKGGIPDYSYKDGESL